MTRSGLARLLGAYLFHRKRLWFWALFAVLLAAYTVNIKLAVELNDWNGRFYDALQRVDKDAIYRELVFSSPCGRHHCASRIRGLSQGPGHHCPQTRYHLRVF